MKRSVKYLMAGIPVLLACSACASVREADEARKARERAAAQAQQQALVEQVLQEMEAEGRMQELPFPDPLDREKLEENKIR
jgi:hypothetical protein